MLCCAVQLEILVNSTDLWGGLYWYATPRVVPLSEVDEGQPESFPLRTKRNQLMRDYIQARNALTAAGRAAGRAAGEAVQEGASGPGAGAPGAADDGGTRPGRVGPADVAGASGEARAVGKGAVGREEAARRAAAAHRLLPGRGGGRCRGRGSQWHMLPVDHMAANRPFMRNDNDHDFHYG